MEGGNKQNKGSNDDNSGNDSDRDGIGSRIEAPFLIFATNFVSSGEECEQGRIISEVGPVGGVNEVTSLASNNDSRDKNSFNIMCELWLFAVVLVRGSKVAVIKSDDF